MKVSPTWPAAVRSARSDLDDTRRKLVAIDFAVTSEYKSIYFSTYVHSISMN